MTRAVGPKWAGLAVVGVAAGTGVLVWAWSLATGGQAGRFPAAPVAALTFLAVQGLSARVRWNSRRLLGPGNLALLLFGLQLVVVPTLFVVQGPSPGVLSALPPDRYINLALLLQSMSYACYSLGLSARTGRVGRPRLIYDRAMTVRIGIVFVGVGAVGMYLRFRTPEALIAYFMGRGDIFESSSTLADAAATFMRPFASYGFIALWAVALLRRPVGKRLSVGEFALLVAALGASATFNYNRAAAVVPLLAIITAYSRFGRRVTVVRAGVTLLILVLVSFQFGQYRTIYVGTRGGEVSIEDAQLTGPRTTLSDTVQVYANGAQFWALTVQEVDQEGPLLGATMLGSVMLPVPILGKPFRGDSGPIRYNRLIYGSDEASDQVLGMGSELYWNFGLGGVAIGYLLLGLLVRRLDDRVESAADPLACYTVAYLGLWSALLTINSLSVAAQILVYFSPPILVMVVVARMTPVRSDLPVR